jgi:hypothetical protein
LAFGLRFLGVALVCGVPRWVAAQELAPGPADERAVELPEYVITASVIANQEPASGYATMASPLRFEPRVDLQVRSMGEAQGDISIRGGIFEGTGVQVGGMPIFDPQTGHYTAELPIPASMLTAPEVLTGSDNTLRGFGATAGTVAFGWRPVRSGGSVAAAFGNGSLDRQSVAFGEVLGSREAGRGQWAMDGEISRSEAGGLIPDGDHRFRRVAARLVCDVDRSQTQVFAGHQKKFFGWPNLYTPFGVAETEDLATTLVMVSHRTEGRFGLFEAAAAFRHNRDDYEFDRRRPGLFNPYEHETTVAAAFARFARTAGPWRFEARGDVAADGIESTSLRWGRFTSRSTWRLAAAAARRWPSAAGAWETTAGASWDDTNRGPGALSPTVELAWTPAGGGGTGAFRAYAQHAEASRVPGYTALASHPASGLFRGDPDLSREKSRNLEAGARWGGEGWSAQVALFRRRDGPLVDWTYRIDAFNARKARMVDVTTTGVEAVAVRTWGAVDVAASYAWLAKTADYGVPVDASFYALNFPKHRATVAVTARLGGGVEARVDHEFRVQEKNLLRRTGGDSAVLASAGLFWQPAWAEGLEVSVIVDNLWDAGFQEIPAVPASPRQITFGMRWQW